MCVVFVVVDFLKLFFRFLYHFWKIVSLCGKIWSDTLFSFGALKILLHCFLTWKMSDIPAIILLFICIQLHFLPECLQIFLTFDFQQFEYNMSRFFFNPAWGVRGVILFGFCFYFLVYWVSVFHSLEKRIWPYVKLFYFVAQFLGACFWGFCCYCCIFFFCFSFCNFLLTYVKVHWFFFFLPLSSIFMSS